MKPKLIKASGELPDIPEDVWPEIMSRLPVKSLLQFRTVSTSWRSMIDDPRLGRLHLNNFRNNREGTHLMVAYGMQRNFSIWRSDPFRKQSKVLLSLGSTNLSVNWRVAFAGDGLLLLERLDISRPPEFKEQKVWNPSTRRSHEIPVLTSPVKADWGPDLGIGYDPVAYDYKLVRLRRVDHSMHSVAVYSLRSRSWKIISLRGKEYFEPIWWQNKVHINGCLYFMAVRAGRSDIWDLRSYDIAKEEFTNIGLPADPIFRSEKFMWHAEMALIDGGHSLAVFGSGSYSLEKDLWVLGGSRGSMAWTKRCSFRADFEHFFCFKNNGDMLTRSFRVKESERVDEVGSLSPQTDEYKIAVEKKTAVNRRFPPDTAFKQKYHECVPHLENLFML